LEVIKVAQKEMVKEKSWKEFRDSGLFWWVNTILHTFGWAIVFEVDDNDTDKIIRAYPARVKFRGFHEASNIKGYQKVSQYMVDNAPELLKEANE
jgi:hypothetical protein